MLRQAGRLGGRHSRLAPTRPQRARRCRIRRRTARSARRGRGGRGDRGTYQRLRDVLRGVVSRFGRHCGCAPNEIETNALVAGFGDWRPFPDTPEALCDLRSRFRLYVVSNVDDDLFALTAPRLRVELDGLITAEQVGSYKSSHWNFEVALDRIGLPRERVLHVAQSIYHDIVPTNELGIANVWVNRRHGRPGGGRDIDCKRRSGF